MTIILYMEPTTPLVFWKKPLFKKLLYILGAVLIGFLTYVIYTKTQTPINIEEEARKEAAQVKTSLSTHLVLPDGDEPDIRKIKEKIEDPFFSRAEIGDYLIIFYKSRIAYIYSPSRDLITNAGVVFVNPQTGSSTPQIKTN